MYCLFAAFFSLLLCLSTAKCPCSDESLCEPIQGRRKEVFGFSTSSDNWRHFDWNVLTTVAWSTDSELLCFAHSKKVRVVSRASGINDTILLDDEARHRWVMDALSFAKDHFLDGINFDYEDPILSNETLKRNGYTQLINQTANAFRAWNPHTQISVDVAWGPFGVDGRFFDYESIAKVSDYIFVMSYDTRSQIYGPCLASANTPFAVADLGVSQYIGLGIPANKLILGLPWYGYTYPCLNASFNDRYCAIQQVPFRGAPCSDAAGSEISWGSIQSLLANSSQIRTEVVEDPLLMSKWFNYYDKRGVLNQMWFDDADTLLPKFQLAKRHDLGGVGVWNFDLIYRDQPNPSSKAITQMWQIMEVFDPGC